MNRRYTTAVLGAIWFVTFVGWLLDWVGRILAIDWLYNKALVEMPGVSINWQAVYFFGWVLSGSLLVAANWEWVGSLLHRATRRRKGDLAVNTAVMHIATTARISDSWAPLPQLRIMEAMRMLQNAVSNGRIYMIGRLRDKAEFVAIKRADWEKNELFRVPTGDGGVSVWMIEKGKPREMRFDGLMIDSEDFYREFPPAPPY